MMELGIGFPNELVTVSGDKTQVSLLNANEKLTPPEEDAAALEEEFARQARDSGRMK